MSQISSTADRGHFCASAMFLSVRLFGPLWVQKLTHTNSKSKISQVVEAMMPVSSTGDRGEAGLSQRLSQEAASDIPI